MKLTELLYLKDSYQKEFSANVSGIKENRVSLERTAFYPEGGGQPSDSGWLSAGEKEFEVTEVKKESGQAWHSLKDSSGLVAGMSVEGKIDWERRYRLMRMHTSAHIIAAIIFLRTGKLITGNQIDWPASRMDFDVSESFGQSDILQIQESVNEELSKGHEVSVSFLPREEALKNPQLMRLRDIMPPSIKEWRIVQIGTIDLQADGGTHVKSTKEVGQIKITKTQNKGQRNKRIYWELVK